MASPWKYKDYYIHRMIIPISIDDPVAIKGYCISKRKDECLVDEDSCDPFDLLEYRDILLKCGGMTYTHIFEYHNGEQSEVTDTYFLTKSQCKMAIDSLRKKEEETLIPLF